MLLFFLGFLTCLLLVLLPHILIGIKLWLEKRRRVNIKNFGKSTIHVPHNRDLQLFNLSTRRRDEDR